MQDNIHRFVEVEFCAVDIFELHVLDAIFRRQLLGVLNDRRVIDGVDLTRTATRSIGR